MGLRQTQLAVSSATGTGSTTGSESVLGMLYAIDYIPGTLDTGATVTVTCESPNTDTNTYFSHTLLVKATAGTSNVRFYPRELVNATADGAALTGTSGGDRALPLLNGFLKVAVASAGTATAGKVVIYSLED